MSRRFHIITFGCQMNVCDSNWIKHALLARGWELAPEYAADVVLINTCSVREKPEQKVYSQLGRLRNLREKNPEFFVCVGGCVAQQVGEEFWHRFPHVRLVFGPDGVASVPESLNKLLAEPALRISLLDFQEYYFERDISIYPEQLPVQAYVNIMQGCDNYCSYCIVPYTRGHQKSRSSKAVIEECQRLADRGVREITLLGQNVNSFGQDKYGDGVSFARLLHEVCSIQALDRVRFTTSHPKDLDAEVINAFGKYSNLCPSLHLPLQSGSNRILRRMGRRYSREDYLRLVQQLRAVRPDIVLTTDLIVGFPGETERDFAYTLDMVERVCFDSSFSFKYSDRPGVKASLFKDKLTDDIKSARLNRLQKLQDRLTGESLQKMINTEVEVLVEGYSNKVDTLGYSWKGREPGGRVVNFIHGENSFLTGDIVKLEIVEAKKHSLFGEEC